jgi:hypothetical protein
MINQFLRHIKDQFDRPREKAEKIAQTLSRREEALKEAPPSAFAVVLDDGQSKHPKFPRATETDIRMSKTALKQNESEMPEEVVKTARYFLDQSAREKIAEPLYEERPEPKATNILFIGDIDRQAWRRRSQEKTASSTTVTIDGIKYPVDNESHLRQAERMFDAWTAPAKTAAEAGRTLAKQAENLGVDLKKSAAERFDRSSLPRSFEEHVSVRRNRAPEEIQPL